MSLKDKLLKNSKLQYTSPLDESKVYNNRESTITSVPMVNVALSGMIDGGLTSGTTMISGESKHFKSGYGLFLTATYLKQHPDSICIFYDTEFGIPEEYFQAYNIDMSRVIHCPVRNAEELKHDLVFQLEQIEKGEKVIILLDSLGNLASKKESEDALDGKSVADMTRAKSFKSLFRMITSQLVLKDIPFLVVNHVYKEMGCLEENTLIKTIKGNKKIKEIQEGDIVYTIKGTQKVTKKFFPKDLFKENRKYYELKFDDGSIIRCTDNHKFFIKNNEWVEAKNLELGIEMY